MANIKSQVKRNKTNDKAHARNIALKSAVRSASKKVRLAVEANDLAASEAALREAVRLIDKSVSKVFNIRRLLLDKKAISNLWSMV